MAAAQTGRTPPSIRTLWAIAKSPELCMTDEDLHALAYRETGKESLRKLTQGEIAKVARVLQSMKDSVAGNVKLKRTDTGGDPRTVEMRRKIYRLMEELNWTPERVNGLSRRLFHVERVEWLNMVQCGKLVEALKAILERERRKAVSE